MSGAPIIGGFDNRSPIPLDANFIVGTKADLAGIRFYHQGLLRWVQDQGVVYQLQNDLVTWKPLTAGGITRWVQGSYIYGSIVIYTGGLYESQVDNNTSIPGTDSKWLLILAQKGEKGDAGSPGKSAYQLWLDNGNAGDFNTFYNSLRGPIGKSVYEIWLDQGNTGSFSDFLGQLKGDPGLSSYQVWLAQGNNGTEQDYLESLKGQKGDPGAISGDNIGDGLAFNNGIVSVDYTEVASQSDLENIKSALTQHPSYTPPSAALTSPQAGTIYEVGQSVAVTLNLAFSQNDAGAATGYSIKKGGTVITIGNSFAETIAMAVAAVQYQGTITYNAGLVRKNNFGDDDPTGKISAGSINSNGLSFQGYYATWYGSCAALPASSADVRSLTGKQYTVQSNTFTLNTGTSQLNMAVVCPSSKTLSTVVDVDALNAVITSEYVYQGTITVNDAAGAAVGGFKIYLKTLGVTYSTNHRHQITLV